MRVNGVIRGKGMRGMDPGDVIYMQAGRGRWNSVVYVMVPNEAWGWARAEFLEIEMKRMLASKVLEEGTSFWKGDRLYRVTEKKVGDGSDYVLEEVENRGLLRDVTRQGRS